MCVKMSASGGGGGGGAQEEDKKPMDQSAHINLKVKGQVHKFLGFFILFLIVWLLRKQWKTAAEKKSIAFCEFFYSILILGWKIAFFLKRFHLFLWRLETKFKCHLFVQFFPY